MQLSILDASYDQQNLLGILVETTLEIGAVINHFMQETEQVHAKIIRKGLDIYLKNIKLNLSSQLIDKVINCYAAFLTKIKKTKQHYSYN